MRIGCHFRLRAAYPASGAPGFTRRSAADNIYAIGDALGLFAGRSYSRIQVRETDFAQTLALLQRLHSGKWDVVDDFLSSGRLAAIMEFVLPAIQDRKPVAVATIVTLTFRAY